MDKCREMHSFMKLSVYRLLLVFVVIVLKSDF